LLATNCGTTVSYLYNALGHRRSDGVLTIPGVRRGKDFWIIRPEREIEFKDANGRWTPLLEPPGSFMQRPDSLSIPAGKSTIFRSDLVTQTAAQSSLQFRLVIRQSLVPTCMISHPFVPAPPRPKVTGFESVDD
jgi:hypothetical protein